MEPRNWANNASPTPPPEPVSPSEGHPVDGNPQTGVPATEPGAYWFHAIAEEIRNVIGTAGLTPDHANLTQLATAIQQLIANAAPEIGQERVYVTSPTFASVVADGDVVYYDSSNSRFDRAIADGTNKQRAVGIADKTNNEVTLFGKLAGLLTGLTPGRYYLSDTTPGAITTTAPSRHVAIGIAKSATELFVDIDADGISLVELPIYPEIQTADNRLAINDNGDGTITVGAGQKWLWRGHVQYSSDDIDTVDRTFAHAANKTYHLRWTAAGGFALKDLTDAGYNPGALPETSAVFDTSRDDILVARLMTDSGNAATITALSNADRLHFSGLVTMFTVEDPGQNVASGLLTLNINWARTPTYHASRASVNKVDPIDYDFRFVRASDTSERGLDCDRYLVDGKMMDDFMTNVAGSEPAAFLTLIAD